jgi:quercetin dioxygenase-like cupin family protein
MTDSGESHRAPDAIHPQVIERLAASPAPERTLRDAGLQPGRWSAGPRAVFGRHRHPRPKRLFVVEGSISFDGLPLAAGEGIRIPAGVEHSALVGDAGVRCVEAFE